MTSTQRQDEALWQKLWTPLAGWSSGIKANLLKNGLWQSILKNTICTTITLIIGIIPAVIPVYGRLTYLMAMVSVFAHPGQRFGQMAEALGLVLVGSVIGIAWAMLGLFLSQLVLDSNVTAAYSIRAVFFALALLGHGILRASTPRLFLAVFWLLLMCLIILTSSATAVSAGLLTQLAYPIVTAAAVVVVCNIAIYPSFSNGLLGQSTIKTLHDTLTSLTEANQWFLSILARLDGAEVQKGAVDDLHVQLAALTERKARLRAQLAASLKTQAECNFELAYAVLPPRSLKPISGAMMSRFVQATIALIGACESKYSMLGDHSGTTGEDTDAHPAATSNDDSDSDTETSSVILSSDTDGSSTDDEPLTQPIVVPKGKHKHLRRIELVKPVREVEGGDIRLLEHLIFQVRAPLCALQAEMEQAARVITTTLAFCYDVTTLPAEFMRPSGIITEEIDIRLGLFTRALSEFDQESGTALGQAATRVYRQDVKGDIMPRIETHLISSLLMNQRLAASQLLSMLQYARLLLESRTTRRNRSRFYLPKISWKKWLRTGGEKDANVLPEDGRKEARAGHGLVEDRRNSVNGEDDWQNSVLISTASHKDEESCVLQPVLTAISEKGKIPRRKGPQKTEVSTSLWVRGIAADVIEFVADSDSLSYALKLGIAGFIVTWPAFVPSLNSWYTSIRGSWASLQLILVFEVSVGTSFQGFFLRAIGTVVGCTIGYLAYVIGNGNQIVAIVILVIGLVPSSYVHVGTPYVKTGLISITSLAVICLGIMVGGSPDQPWEIHLKRMACFLVGGTVALFIELFLFPVRARDRLVESLASCIKQISNMENSIAVGIDSPANIDVKNNALDSNFSEAKEKAEQALAAARTFLPFCLTEPRLKGSFRGQTIIYKEMIYVLSQIIDRMDNLLYLRRAFGSSVLEELNIEVLSYRRNVAGSISITLFAIHEALTTRLPLPQFLPSSRVAQLRYIRRVRELLQYHHTSAGESGPTTRRGSMVQPAQILKSTTKQNFISWNAGSAGMMEIIEYVEELVDLSKLLVGVNAFRTGMLERPKFHEYIAKLNAQNTTSRGAASSIDESSLNMSQRRSSGIFRRRPSLGRAQSLPEAKDWVPRRRSTFGSWSGNGAVDDDFTSKREIDIPMSLQRVKTKRREELERFKMVESREAKGKRIKGSKTWVT